MTGTCMAGASFWASGRDGFRNELLESLAIRDEYTKMVCISKHQPPCFCAGRHRAGDEICNFQNHWNENASSGDCTRASDRWWCSELPGFAGCQRPLVAALASSGQLVPSCISFGARRILEDVKLLLKPQSPDADSKSNPIEGRQHLRGEVGVVGPIRIMPPRVEDAKPDSSHLMHPVADVHQGQIGGDSSILCAGTLSQTRSLSR
ncbi:hypothetical protein QBC47DRAFT_183627 [Echria macrotheca]|uniref:Uncharacterized protein n=1 Tax=Echria macrotheca TaxID=438768 RepID=A0AAJ0F5Y8_9PEZI|nr:hypothetical protein QBC47DRAFT_183627 [Echria macrotheca]